MDLCNGEVGGGEEVGAGKDARIIDERSMGGGRCGGHEWGE